MHEVQTPTPVKDWARLIAALVLLNVSLTFSNIWPTLAVWPTADVSVEVAACVLALLFAWRWRGAPSQPTRRWLAGLWVALVVGRYIDVTVRSLYGRDLNLYWDLRLIPDVGAMFAVVAKSWLIAVAVLVAMVVPVLIYLPVRWALGRVIDAAVAPRTRGPLGILASGVLVLWLVQSLGPSEPLMVRVAEPVTQVYARQVGELFYEMTKGGAEELAPPPPMRSDLSRVSGADVLVLFLESYGAVSWDRPDLAGPLASSRARLDADIRETGRAVVSAFVESTTFGGESWLAHISLLTGTEVRDQRTNMRLMAQRRDTLVNLFANRGYRTIAIMPGLTRGWPEGVFYGFEDIYNLERLAYSGPPFGWWSITDQFALARMDALGIAPQPRRPTFVFFPTISTHAPFTPRPPYQADWPRVLTPTPYDEADLDRAWAEPPDWLNLGPGYAQALAYAYEVLGGYLRLRADRDLVMILIGDHQPPALVSGEGATWEVPVHVIASRPAVLDRLRQHKFREGLTPQHPALARMDTLLPLLLDAFGDP